MLGYTTQDQRQTPPGTDPPGADTPLVADSPPEKTSPRNRNPPPQLHAGRYWNAYLLLHVRGQFKRWPTYIYVVIFVRLHVHLNISTWTKGRSLNIHRYVVCYNYLSTTCRTLITLLLSFFLFVWFQENQYQIPMVCTFLIFGSQMI